ncbi:uncharacterized protein BDZ99DRAFT_513469 [Mytilinidion resinicola]|uniref:Uncharacterized protein n=1 Tax=Mytilinidion resinicola TaxID=574789 RepID=A0A6A6ZAA9_9PEZI|nr:uncharacterized protein BDZ99DRAFT_513469 [Mytilinidion resinicola]KAF2817225.1 hypothetical protein BDZ99DRAFT_513469 [Mytilinidion resinicola]
MASELETAWNWAAMKCTQHFGGYPIEIIVPVGTSDLNHQFEPHEEDENKYGSDQRSIPSSRALNDVDEIVVYKTQHSESSTSKSTPVSQLSHETRVKTYSTPSQNQPVDWLLLCSDEYTRKSGEAYMSSVTLCNSEHRINRKEKRDTKWYQKVVNEIWNCRMSGTKTAWSFQFKPTKEIPKLLSKLAREARVSVQLLEMLIPASERFGNGLTVCLYKIVLPTTLLS